MLQLRCKRTLEQYHADESFNFLPIRLPKI